MIRPSTTYSPTAERNSAETKRTRRERSMAARNTRNMRSTRSTRRLWAQGITARMSTQ